MENQLHKVMPHSYLEIGALPILMSKWFVQVTSSQLLLPLKDIQLFPVLLRSAPFGNQHLLGRHPRWSKPTTLCPSVAPLHQKVAKASPWRLQWKMAASFHEKLEVLYLVQTSHSTLLKSQIRPYSNPGHTASHSTLLKP